MKKLVLLVASLIAILAPLVVRADTYTTPNQTQIKSAQVVHDVKDADDMFVVFHYVWNYNDTGDIPAKPASDVIMFQLLSTDGTEVLASNVPYSIGDPFKYGYQQGMSGFYFNPAEAAALTYGNPYIIRVTANPLYFDSFTPVDYVLGEGNYTDVSDTQDENRDTLSTYILGVMKQLETVFSTTLRGYASQGLVLNSDGEVYIRGALVGIQSMCPGIFYLQQLPPEYDTTTWTQGYAENVTDNLSGTNWDNAWTSAGSFLGISGKFAFGICLFALVLFIVANARKKWKTTEAGSVAGVIIFTGGTFLYGIPWALWAVGGVICAFILAWYFFLRQAY